MPNLKFRVEAEAGDLTIGKQTFPVGEHEENVDADVARALASAEATGGVKILSGNVSRSHIESDEDSLKALDKAMANGDWQVGNVEDFIAQKKGLVDEFEKMLEMDEHADQHEVMAQTVELAKKQLTEAESQHKQLTKKG